MTSILQLALFALIVVSFALVVGVPVVFASPNGWTENKSFVFSQYVLESLRNTQDLVYNVRNHRAFPFPPHQEARIFNITVGGKAKTFDSERTRTILEKP
jgi:photosystem II PsbZ protein